MKLADDALVQIIEFLRQGLTENKDISEMLRGLDLHPNVSGKLSVTGPAVPTAWSQQDSETD